MEWLADLWEAVEQNVFFVYAEGKVVLEAPEDWSDDEDDAECIFRVFPTAVQASIYEQQIKVWLEGVDTGIVRATLTDVFGMMTDVKRSAMSEYGCPPRLVISTVDADEYPESLDVLWSQYLNKYHVIN